MITGLVRKQGARIRKNQSRRQARKRCGVSAHSPFPEIHSRHYINYPSFTDPSRSSSGLQLSAVALSISPEQSGRGWVWRAICTGNLDTVAISLSSRGIGQGRRQSGGCSCTSAQPRQSVSNSLWYAAGNNVCPLGGCRCHPRPSRPSRHETAPFVRLSWEPHAAGQLHTPSQPIPHHVCHSDRLRR